MARIKEKIDKAILDAYIKANEAYYEDEFEERNAFYYQSVQSALDMLIHSLKEIKKYGGSTSTGSIVMALQEGVRQLTNIEKDPDNYDRYLCDISTEVNVIITPFLQSLQPKGEVWTVFDTQRFFFGEVVGNWHIIGGGKALNIAAGNLSLFCYFMSRCVGISLVNPKWANVLGDKQLVIYNGKAQTKENLQKGQDYLNQLRTSTDKDKRKKADDIMKKADNVISKIMKYLRKA